MLQTYHDKKFLIKDIGAHGISTWLYGFNQNMARAVFDIEEKVENRELALLEISCILDPNVSYFLTPELSASTPEKLSHLIDSNWELGKEHFKSGRIFIWLKYLPSGQKILDDWKTFSGK